MDTVKIEKKNTLLIAHRGLSGLEKENTAAAFIAAGNRSYFGFECDIHLTSDNTFVICHDASTKRVSPEDVVIRSASASEIAGICLYDVNTTETRNYLRIPTLQEFIKISEKYQKECIIEVKLLLTDRQCQDLIETISSLNYLHRCIFISFSYENLLLLRKIYPESRLQYLTGTYSEEVFIKCTAVGADLDILYTELKEEIVQRFHKAGLKVNAWTVNNPVDAATLVSWHIDYITTNILE
jgi:glycerophosphoryl diester phosphodiesterase